MNHQTDTYKLSNGVGMCMAGWPERAIRWYESLQQLCVG